MDARFVAALPLAVMVMLVGTTGSASAFFTLREQVEQTSPSSSANKSVSVSCPVGKRVITAGARVSPGGPDVLLEAVRPNSTLTGVTARAHEDETGTSAAWTVTAFAICAPAPTGLQLVTATSAPSSADKSVTATCPTGKRVLGTGAAINSPNGQVLLDGIMPNADLTSVTVNALEDETGNGSSWSLSSYAICAARVVGLRRVRVTSSSDSTSSRSLTPSCGEDGVIGVGGTANSPNGQGVIEVLLPGGNNALFRAWEDDTGNAADWSITAYAICAGEVQRSSFFGPRSTERTKWVEGQSCSAGVTTGLGGELVGALGQAWLARFYPEGPNYSFVQGLGNDATSNSWGLTAHFICATGLAGFEVVTAYSVSDSESGKSVTATCPAGKRVIGAAGDELLLTAAILDGVRPNPTLTSVTATGWEAGTGTDNPWQVAAYALCAPAPPGLQLVSSTSPPAAEEFAVARATCPAGKHLIGTGGAIDGGFGRAGFDDLKPDGALTETTVTAFVDQFSFGTVFSATAYAICVNR